MPIFYRIAGPGELLEMGWEEATESAITLGGMARPGRGGAGALAARDHPRHESRPNRAAGGSRSMVGTGAFGERVTRARALKAMLLRTGWDQAERTPDDGGRLLARL